MKTIGFINSHKKNEKRIALLPQDLSNCLDLTSNLYFENGYGTQLGIQDTQYLKAGAYMASRNNILQNCDIICDVKAGDAEYLNQLADGRTIFGWVHPHVSDELKNTMLKKRFSVYAWEEMMEQGRQVFYRNNELAGEASVLHAAQCVGTMLYGKQAAVIGRGNTAQGAIHALTCNGASVTIYGRNQEDKLRADLGNYDVVVNAVLWDPKRTDHILSRDALKTMKPNTLLIDVSCDEHGAVETSRPTHLDHPTFIVDGIIHYCVDHSPSIFYQSASQFISTQVSRFIRPLVTESPDSILESGHVMEQGHMLLSESCR